MKSLDLTKLGFIVAMVCATVLVVSGKVPPQYAPGLAGALCAYTLGLIQQSPLKPTTTVVAGHDVVQAAPEVKKDEEK